MRPHPLTASTTLTASGDVLGRILLFRAAYRLGEEVLTVFDCSKSTRPCLQLTVSLICEEELKSEATQPTAGVVKPISSVISQEVKCCQDTMVTHFTLPIPWSLCQSFQDNTSESIT